MLTIIIQKVAGEKASVAVSACSRQSRQSGGLQVASSLSGIQPREPRSKSFDTKINQRREEKREIVRFRVSKTEFTGYQP
jgi:hypothetical protein